MHVLSLVIIFLTAVTILAFLPRRRSAAAIDALAAATGSSRKINIVFIMAGAFIALVILLAWLALDRIEAKVQTDAGNALQTVLQTTRESLDIWAANEKAAIAQVAADPQLAARVERLLVLPRDKKTLMSSAALGKLRSFFRWHANRFGKSGFFVVAPDFVTIAAMEDELLGTKNAMASQALDLFNRALQGKPVMIPPIWSAVAANPSSIHPDGTVAAIFFAAPVRNARGQVMAVVARQIDPGRDFTRLIQLGRIGNTGETYAFNQYGVLLSESRFDSDLRKIGLIGTHRKGILNLSLRDPGGNLAKGFKPSVPRYQQPLTQMARLATQGKSGMDITGYRDYRGVPVYGAWLWSRNLGIGLATEIDRSEALSPYYTARRAIIIILAITVLLALGSLMFAVTIDQRANRALRRANAELEQRVAQRTAQLSASEERFALAVRGVDAGIWSLDPRTDQSWFSPRFRQLLGHGETDLDATLADLLRIIHPEEREAVSTALQKHLDHHTPFNEICRIRDKSGEYRWFRVTGQALWDDTGRAQRMAGSIIDITEGKIAQDELRKLSRATENSPASVVITDRSGTIEYVNATFCEVTGYSAREAVGQNPRVLKSGNLPASFYKNLWDTILSGKTWKGDFINKKKNGEQFWESASISPIKNDAGEITHFVAVKQDISERKQMEEQLQRARQAADAANRAKSDFLANMSHEIRTPMNAVIGMAHLALKTELTPRQRDYLEKIQSAANSLLGIINDILDFSKIEAGKLEIETVDFNLDDVLDNLASLVTVKAREKEDLEVLFAAARDVPRYLVGDPLRLGQVLLNLTNNAVKFTPSGEIVVSIELLEKRQDAATLQFSVRDTGIGMTEEQISRLFQSFSQADTSTTRKYGGTGLGLTISRQLVNLMGGDIQVQSQYGQGTTFSFTVDCGLAKERAQKRFAPLKDFRGMKVLVVDDNATSREIFRNLLESFSFEVVMAASGEEGLTEIETAAGQKPFELVIMDWKMPGMDGIEAAMHIKKHPGLERIPKIILVTAYGREEVMQRAAKADLEGFLLKPVNPSVLFDAVMQAFSTEMPAKSPLKTARSESTALEQIRGARILLVEDNEINQQVAREILESAGLIVAVAGNGREAVEAVKASGYDAVLMDVQMPVMDGYAATRAIRNWELQLKTTAAKDSGQGAEAANAIEDTARLKIPEPKARAAGRRLPIIAMTAHAMAGDEKKSLAAGMDGHVTKPIDPEQLFAALLKWIPAVRSRPAVRQAPDATASPQPVPSPPPAEGLPESLAGFDLKAGLQRLTGNRALYRKLLLDFHASYRGEAEKIRTALEAEDLEQLHRRVHNLKGLAGNLAATKLQAAATALDKLVRSAAPGTLAPPQLKQKFAQLEKALHQALDAVATLGLPAAAKTPPPSENNLAARAAELPEAALRRLQEAAEMGDVEQIKLIADEVKSESAGLGPLCDRLLQLAENFDIDAILALIRPVGR